jgi:hypothetical protein
MKKRNQSFIQLFLLPFIGFLLFASLIAMGVQEQWGIHPATSIAVMAAVAFFYAIIVQKNNDPKRGKVYLNGVEVEIWANYIIERLWKDNKFLQYAFSDDDKVLAGKIVHIPQPGSKPTTMKNRAVFPATAVRRVDTDIIYPLDEYTTDPTHIQDAEKVELSYDKINSVYGDHAGTLVEDVAGDAIYKWLVGIGAASILRTTGANTSEILTGATGTRKVMVHDTLRKAQKVMNKQNIPAEDRYALLSSDMADQLFESLSNTQYRDFSQYANAETGVIGKLYGFSIMQRSEVATSDVTGLIINPYGAAVEADTNDVSFCWQKNSVARAIGEVKFFENPDRAEYYGDVYSALLRFGGRRRRADNAGVVAIIQTS